MIYTEILNPDAIATILKAIAPKFGHDQTWRTLSLNPFHIHRQVKLVLN